MIFYVPHRPCICVFVYVCVCTLACTSLFRIWFIVRFLLFATLFADISLGIVLIAAVFLAIARLLAVDDVDAIAHIIFPIVKTSHRRSGYQKRISPFVWLSSAIRNHLTLTWSHFHSLCGQSIGSVLSISFPLCTTLTHSLRYWPRSEGCECECLT